MLIIASAILLLLAILLRKVIGKVFSIAAIVFIIGFTAYVILGFANVVPVPDWLMDVANKYFV